MGRHPAPLRLQPTHLPLLLCQLRKRIRFVLRPRLLGRWVASPLRRVAIALPFRLGMLAKVSEINFPVLGLGRVRWTMERTVSVGLGVGS